MFGVSLFHYLFERMDLFFHWVNGRIAALVVVTIAITFLLFVAVNIGRIDEIFVCDCKLLCFGMILTNPVLFIFTGTIAGSACYFLILGSCPFFFFLFN